MTKKFFMLMLALVVMLLFTSCGYKKTDNIKQSLVTVVVEYSDHHNFSLGSAVAKNNILTTAHIFEDTYEKAYISIYFYINENKYYLDLISIDTHNDLALLCCQYEFAHTINYQQKNISSGDTVFLISDSIPSHMPTKAKVVNNRQTVQYDTYQRSLMAITTYASNGDSGAPIVTNNGYVIGMLSAKHAEQDTTFFAITATTIAQFLGQ